MLSVGSFEWKITTVRPILTILFKNFVRIFDADILRAEGLAQWLRSLPPNPEVPGSIPGLVEG